MRILLITSRSMASTVEKIIRSIAGNLKHRIDIAALPVDVMSLLTIRSLKELLERHVGLENLRRYDLVIVPGTIRETLESLSKYFGTKVVKGPSDPRCLKTVLLNDEFLKLLDTSKPAEIAILNYLKNTYRSVLLQLDKECHETQHVSLATACIPCRGIPRLINLVIASHIAKDPRCLDRASKHGVLGIYLDDETIVNYILEFTRNYKIEAIYLGTEIEERKLKTLLNHVRPKVVFVSSDWFKELELLHRLAPHIDFVLGISFRKLEEVDVYHHNHFFTTLSFNVDDVVDWIESLAKLRDRGFCIYIDLCDVIRQCSADSPGIVYIIMTIAFSLNCGVVVSCEGIGRFYNVSEEVEIAHMMNVLRIQGIRLTEGIIDLFKLKDFDYVDIPLIGVTENTRIVEAQEPYVPEMDPEGFFRIRVNHADKAIEALYIGKKGSILLRGDNAWKLLKPIIEYRLTSTSSHMFYLGYELSKAEIALKLGKTYIQDRPMFSDVMKDDS